jgi:hypothetical protein
MYVIKKVLIDSKEVEKTLFPKKYFFQVTVCVPGICKYVMCTTGSCNFCNFYFLRAQIFGTFYQISSELQ